MSYSYTFSIHLGPTYAGLKLAAQLIDTAGDDVGSEVTTRFIEIGNGDYLWTATVPDGHRGGVLVYEDGTPGTVLAVGAINPEDAELVGDGSAGGGAGYYTDTVESPAGTPVDGARVQLATDDKGENVAYETYTNALGVFEMRPDPGTYYRFIELAGHTFSQGVEVEVTEP